MVAVWSIVAFTVLFPAAYLFRRRGAAVREPFEHAGHDEPA